MKLLLCRNCSSFVQLTKRKRKCDCGQSWGKYKEDGLHAVISGPHAQVIGINNFSLIRALRNQDEKDAQGSEAILGELIEAWVFPKASKRIERRP